MKTNGKKPTEVPPDMVPVDPETVAALEKLGQDNLLVQERLRRIDAEIEAAQIKIQLAEREKADAAKELVGFSRRAEELNKTLQVESREDLITIDGRWYVKARKEQEHPATPTLPPIASVDPQASVDQAAVPVEVKTIKG